MGCEVPERRAAGFVQEARAIGNIALCRDHFRLVMKVDQFLPAEAGQFVHVSPVRTETNGYRIWDEGAPEAGSAVMDAAAVPMLRRAYSIAGLRRETGGVEIEIIYRVVGKGTRWLRTLAPGDSLSVLGPLGNAFPIDPRKSMAWLVAGGVGLPPMLWLAEALRRAGKQVIAFCGAQSRDLLAMTLDDLNLPAADATRATMSAAEFARHGVPAVVSTDDGTLGFRGHIGAALTAYHRANPARVDDVVVYTCGPERMMRFVAEDCGARGIECHVCMERNMACGTGMCQSCVVPIQDPADPQAWRYWLCCTEGPIFPARQIIWEPAGK